MIIPFYRYEDDIPAERDRLRLQLEAAAMELAHAQGELEHAARDIANLIEDASDPDELGLAADQCSDLAAKLRRLAGEKDGIEKALKEMG
jgi:hypothetical protein